MTTLRCSLAAGAIAGAILALGDLAFGVPGALATGAGAATILGASVVILVDLVAGLLFGLVAAPFLAAWANAAGLERAAAGARSFGRAWIRPAPPVDEARRVAWLAAVGVVALAAGAALIAVGAEWLPRVRRDPVLGVVLGAQAIAIVVASIAAAAPIARLLAPSFAPLARRLGAAFSLRGAAIALALAAVGLAIAWRAPIVALARAIDLRPALLAFAFATAFFVALSILFAPDGALRRRALAATRLRGIVVGVTAIAILAAIALGPASHSARAARLYRGRAPIGSKLASLAARALDFDRDGYSAFLGDGDCAASDPRRHPGAREIAENGVDDDCFDGDLVEARAPFPPPPPAPRPAHLPSDLSFVIILVDSLRHDHMGLYGYARPTTPRVDEWAKRAVVFDLAYAPGPYTYASVPALLTGKFPSMLPRKVMRKSGRVSAADRTLAEIFSAAGFKTALASDNGGTLAETGVDKGFQKKLTIKDDAERITDTAIQYLDGFGADRFFLWVDYFAPHGTYIRHAGVPEFGDGFMDRYDHEIRYADAAIGRLLDRLSRRDLAGRVVVAFVADHGEAFGEHGTYYHGHNLHDENVRVPLLIAIPGVAPRRLAREPVSLIDLFPTFLNLAGLPIPDETRGHDLTRAITTGEEEEGRHVFMESHFFGYGADNAYQAAVATRRHKLIEDTGTRQLLLFDLERDPGETRDLSEQEPDTLVRLRRAAKYFQSFGRDD